VGGTAPDWDVPAPPTDANERLGIEVRNAGRAAVKRREVVRRAAILMVLEGSLLMVWSDVCLMRPEYDCEK